MNNFGLIGYPLTHSFSAQYFSEKFFREGIHDSHFELYPLTDINELPALINNNPALKGLSVTIPYKEKVLSYLNFVDPISQSIGAVNCIRITREKGVSLKGYNTDEYGFEESLKPLLTKHHQKAIILGSGGASKAVVFVLRKLNIDFIIVSRDKGKLPNALEYSELNEDIISSHHLIINTTPVGMFPHISEAPQIPYQFISREHLLYDLVYNPAVTQFIKKGKAKGATAVNGLQMLYLQAEKSWQIWREV
jgi:shikimate dehydrogenase